MVRVAGKAAPIPNGEMHSRKVIPPQQPALKKFSLNSMDTAHEKLANGYGKNNGSSILAKRALNEVLGKGHKRIVRIIEINFRGVDRISANCPTRHRNSKK